MNLTEIFLDSIRYPFSDITNFLIVGILALLASISSVIMSFGVENGAVLVIASLITIIFAFILSGYGVSVARKGIENSDEFPFIDLRNNFIDGIKACIIGLVYFLIPLIILAIIAALTGALTADFNHLASGLGIFLIAVILIFIIFAIFEVIALARFAATGEIGAALSIGEVIEDIKSIGTIKVIAFTFISAVIMVIASLIASIFNIIPFIGIIISSVLIGAFSVLFLNKALGLLYASA